MVSEEPAHLVDAPKTCTLCHLEGMHMFLYNNNNNSLQPRYECLGCGHQFTHGGVAYRKKNRKKFRARASSSSRPSPLQPPSPFPPHGPPASPAPASPSALDPEPAASPIRPRSPSESADHERARARIATDAAKSPVEVEGAGPLGAQVVTWVRVTGASPSPHPAASPSSEPAEAPRPCSPSAVDRERESPRMARNAAISPVEAEAAGLSDAQVVTGVRVARASPSAHPGAPSPSASEPPSSSIHPRFSSAADRERASARMTRTTGKLLMEAGAAGPSDAQVVTGVRGTRASPSPQPASLISPSPAPPAASPIRPRFPSAADHVRARARMARDASTPPVEVEAGAGPSDAQVVTGVRVTRAAGGVVPEPPSKLLYQVRIKVSGQEDMVRCVLMDLESGIPDGF